MSTDRSRPADTTALTNDARHRNLNHVCGFEAGPTASTPHMFLERTRRTASRAAGERCRQCCQYGGVLKACL